MDTALCWWWWCYTYYLTLLTSPGLGAGRRAPIERTILTYNTRELSGGMYHQGFCSCSFCQYWAELYENHATHPHKGLWFCTCTLLFLFPFPQHNDNDHVLMTLIHSSPLSLLSEKLLFFLSLKSFISSWLLVRIIVVAVLYFIRCVDVVQGVLN